MTIITSSISRRTLLGQTIALSVAAASGSSAHAAAPKRARWMAGKWGLMVHWLAPGPSPKAERPRDFDLNSGVNGFNVDAFADQVEAIGAQWVIFTLGQNGGVYCSPNAYLASIAGAGLTSKRDLAMEVMAALQKRNIRFIAYITGEIKAVPQLHRAFRWNPSDQSEFQRRYTRFLAEYSRKFGTGCAGWWIDGCYDWPDFPNKDRDWPMWTSALRAGNPDAALAFNDGCFLEPNLHPLTADQDYYAGECNFMTSQGPGIGNTGKRFITYGRTAAINAETQSHILTPIDNEGKWGYDGWAGIKPPLYSPAALAAMIRNCRNNQIAMTFNASIYQEGVLNDATVKALIAVRALDRPSGNTNLP